MKTDILIQARTSSSRVIQKLEDDDFRTFDKGSNKLNLLMI